MAGVEEVDGGFVKLGISGGKDFLLDLLVDGLEPLGGSLDPAGHGLAREVNLVAFPKYFLLTVEREVIAVF